MNFITKSLRAMIPTAAGFALAISTPVRAETVMPETPSDVAAPPADATKTPSGLASKVLQAGKGDQKPAAEDTVTVHYSGWTTDGKLFDSSVKRGKPTSFPLNGVIKGWTEGLQLMVEGEKRRFWIPADLAYGENPGGGRPGGLLVFDVELIKIGK
jgi:FKBP-type peptidyl-prolyl cis-trans isomerase